MKRIELVAYGAIGEIILFLLSVAFAIVAIVAWKLWPFIVAVIIWFIKVIWSKSVLDLLYRRRISFNDILDEAQRKRGEMTWIFRIEEEIESCSECRLFENCEEIDSGRDIWLSKVNRACPYIKPKEVNDDLS